MSRANPRFRRQNNKLPTPNHNVYKVSLIGQIEGQVTISTFFYRDALSLVSASLTDLQNLANAINGASALVAKYVACCSSDWKLTGYIVIAETSLLLSPLVGSTNQTGGGPAGHEPTEVAAWLIRRTATRGQCGRGRVSTPAVPTSWVTASSLTTLTAHNALATEMQNVYTSGGDTFTPALFSRNGSHAFPGFGVADLVGVTVDSLLGTVRRRKIGRGK